MHIMCVCTQKKTQDKGQKKREKATCSQKKRSFSSVFKNTREQEKKEKRKEKKRPVHC